MNNFLKIVYGSLKLETWKFLFAFKQQNSIWKFFRNFHSRFSNNSMHLLTLQFLNMYNETFFDCLYKTFRHSEYGRQIKKLFCYTIRIQNWMEGWAQRRRQQQSGRACLKFMKLRLKLVPNLLTSLATKLPVTTTLLHFKVSAWIFFLYFICLLSIALEINFIELENGNSHAAHL